MYTFLYAAGLLAGLVQFTQANPFPQYSQPLTGDGALQDRNLDVCKAVNGVVAILKIYKATPFCSSFLGISTSVIPTIQTVSVPATLTQTETVKVTVTSTVQTNIISVTAYTTVATVPTTIATTTVQSTSTSTTTITPAPDTATVTIYTTPGAAKRTAAVADQEKRAVDIPGFLSAFKSTLLSSACSCLSIPTPITTSTSLATQTVTTTVSVTTITSEVIPATATELTTTTILVTSFEPATAIATNGVVATVTTELPRATPTVYLPFHPKCLNILSKSKLFTGITPRRSYSYPAATVPVGTEGDETAFSKCCQRCYDSLDCGQFYTYPAATDQWRCQIVPSNSAILEGVSDVCPRGRAAGEGVTGQISGSWVSQARGIGPCYGYDVPL